MARRLQVLVLTMSSVIDYQVEQGIARVTLNRPDKMNALNLDLFKALAVAGILAESFEQDALMGKPNQIEAVTANFEKRAPRFIDPQ
jgi:enoyl-CoA hydratase/carnithine racemase